MILMIGEKAGDFDRRNMKYMKMGLKMQDVSNRANGFETDG